MRDCFGGILFFLSLVGIMISTIVSPATKGILAAVDVLPGTLTNGTEIVCATDCYQVCKYSNGVATPGMLPCWSFGLNVTDGPVLCVGESVCCSTSGDGNCLSMLYAPVCKVTCGVHIVLHGTAIVKYGWLLTGGPMFSFHYDCGPLPIDYTECVPPTLMRPPRYFMPLPLFILLMVSIVMFIVSICLMCGPRCEPQPQPQPQRPRPYYIDPAPTAPVARVL